MKYQSPVNYSHISVGFSDRHPALDMGWLLKYKDDKNKSYNQPIYAIGNGKVLFNGNTSDGGKTLVIAHNYNSTHDLWAGYSHNSKHDVKVGDIVKQGDKIANMGNTGKSRGEHLHLRMGIIPKGKSFSWSLYNSYKRVNPEGYLFRYPHQEVEGLKALPKEEPKKKSNATIAKEVINGKWGNGADRKNRLEKAGYNYKEVQAEVNKQLNVKPAAKPAPKPQPSKPKKEYVSVGGRHTLYKASTGTGRYGAANQNLAHRRMEVLERKNGRVRVNAKPFMTRGKRTFDVDSFWVKL